MDQYSERVQRAIANFDRLAYSRDVSAESRDDSGKWSAGGHHTDKPDGSGVYQKAHKAARDATDNAYEMSRSMESEKKFSHGMESAAKARAYSGQGEHRLAAEHHRAASKAIAKGRQGFFGDKGGKAHDKMELAHNDAADLHEAAHKVRYSYGMS